MAKSEGGIGETIKTVVYALLIAYTNDFLQKEDMAAASSGLLFLNGLGAIFGPLATGWLMDKIGPHGFFLFICVLFVALAAYAAYLQRREATRKAAQAYDAQALLGDLGIIYNFGNDLIDDQQIEINCEQIKVPGFAQPLLFKKDERYGDMLD